MAENVPIEMQNILLHHAVLSRTMPQEEAQFPEDGLMLMEKMIETIKNLAESIPTKTVELFERLGRVNHDLTEDVVSDEIADLKPGDSFAMFIRQQYSVFMVHVLRDADLDDEQAHHVVVATFPTSLHPRHVYEHDSDLEFNYPSKALKVKFSTMLKSTEFANQLILLDDRMPHGEFESNDHVFKWLMTLLADEKSTTPSMEKFPIVTKKIRDESFSHSERQSLRRSGLYMSMKVILQHSLTMELGAEIGKFVYKIVMLKFFIELCEFYENAKTILLDTDLLSQMIAKMARRVEKLSRAMPESINETITDFYENTILETKGTIQAIRAKIDRQIREIQDDDKSRAQLRPLSDLNFETDIRYMIPNLEEYLCARSEASQRSYNPRSTIKSPNHYIDPEKRRWIEFENMILHQLSWKNEQKEANEIRQWMIDYREYAMDKYKGNPVMTSRMMLVHLKLIALLDRRATHEYPLYKQYRSGINSNIFNALLLPHRSDTETALLLERYFRMRNANAPHPGLIEENHISENSYSVQFAKDNVEMREVLLEILKLDVANKKRKESEVNEGRKNVQRLREKAKQLGCSYFTDRFGDHHHNHRCQRCFLNKQANKVRIEEYEHLLPNAPFEQLAVVFELRIPNLIACLRDVLCAFVKLCTGKLKPSTIKGNWVECEGLLDFNVSTSRLVTLGSTKRRKLNSIHVDEAFDRFIVNNSLNCVFHALDEAIPTSLADNAIKSVCTFKTQDEYLGLQWTLNTTTHTENQVLARQSECPQNLSISEYKQFGSLRADGHRMQLRKLYGLIETEALSFEKTSVLSLIMQTLWECGHRDTHVDFSDSNFCSAMIELLSKYIGHQQDNWMHPFKLLMATLIAVRVFEINDNETIAKEIANLLCSIRAIVWDWDEKIQEVIEKTRDLNEENHRELRLKLIYVAMIGCLTFFVFPKHKHYERIFSVGNDLIAPHRSWLNFIILLRNNLMMYEQNENQLPANLQIFLRLIEIVGVHLQPKMTDLIEQNSHELFEVIKKHWLEVVYATNEKTVTFHAEHSNICVIKVIIKSELHELTIDIVNGLFLVDNEPISRLPLEIVQDEAYQRVFGNAVLEVKPIGRQRFRTVYNGFQYEFRKIYNVFIITERDKEIERELIHHKVFWDEFPFLLSRDYCHWWNKQDNCIEFRHRQRAVGQRFASGEAKVDYRLDLTTRHLIELKTKRNMLDVKSDSFRQIVKQLKRLEHRSYIHVLLESPRVATAELVRMKLKFKIDCSQDDMECEPQLMSNEFSGMHVSSVQKIGTLYGLDSGLVLENRSNDSKILLMPHNDDMLIERTDSHVYVRINTKVDIQNPPFYQYQVDEICQQLKASNSTHSSWFYLAYLHAITSHGQIESFTGMTGTERALQILQSAFAWSSVPYESDAIKMLTAIAKLTPIRKMVGLNQSVTFPENIPTHCAQDSFIFIVNKLLEDSQRLRGLHSNATDAVNLDIDTDLTLNGRDYHRCLQYQPNLRISETFIEHKQWKTSLPQMQTFSFTPSIQTVSILYHKRSYKVPTGLNLLNFLTNRAELKAIRCVSSILNHNMYEDFQDIWICLYDAVRNQELNDEEMALIFSFFAHQNEEFEPAVLALQAVAMNATQFQQIDPPAVDRFIIELGTYDAERMSNILKCALESTDLSEEVTNAFVDQVVAKITESWPCDEINLLDDFAIFGADAATLNLAVNQRLIAWNNNHKLYEFIDNVHNCLRSLPRTEFPANLPQYFPFIMPDAEAKQWIKTEIDFNETIREHFSTLNEVIDEARDVWITDENRSPRTSKVWWLIIEDAWNFYKSKHLIQAGLLPRLAPSSLLSQLLSDDVDRNLKYLVGAWAVTVTREQREKRIKMYSERPELQASMNREIANKPHANWKPCKRPEWLIFEIEQDVTIREIQIKVAQQMIEPPVRDGIDARHSVMQLNMGEGKTAVIVPILAAVLADGTLACQITVLKSMFSRNLKFLRQYLGGVLNRRVYTFPCRRNLPIDQYIEEIQDIYEECMSTKGVILTLPEYRLSMELKVYDSIGKGDNNLAKSFLDVYKWQEENVRNILDESDAILQANYQLIYTIGNQLEPDGGLQRWTVAQALLKRVPYHMKTLYEQNGKDKVEFDDKYIKKRPDFGASKVNHRPDVFIPCRILDDDIFDKLKTALADDFLNGRTDIEFPELNDSLKETIKTVLIDKSIDKKPSSLINSFPPNEQNIIMILSGLLRFEVLKLALTKRWRVNYGVDPNSQRRMAVPFKAKDVATESTEFGHPDVAVCFTQISYYYSGLTDIQLRQLFELLESKQNAVSTYAKWIQSIPSKLINRSIRSYTGINIDDLNQRSILFPLLRFNMHVIDFWLENFVYPYEAKIFEQKLMCTAWDLCSEQLKHCVTGFSGTNDTKNALPMPIAQNDLAELESTNEHVRQILLQPENQSYESLPVNVSGMEILQRLTERKIPVLLDSGALMLELTNEQVADEWLKETSEIDYDAAVYFDSRDTLQTIDRNGAVTEFDFSVYRENLNRCLVYLDDVHTRGTDLKFPLNWKACVTLSGDIPRDKTVQSCMRMRQLGTNHQICFWASCEADIGIRKICDLSADDCITNEHVIEFISNNSRRMETTNMVHWTAAALNYTKKMIGYQSFDTDDEDSMENLFEKCVDDEFIDLNEMYGDKEETLLRDIAWSKFDKIASEFRHRSHNDIKVFVRNMQDRVDEILDRLAPNVKQFSSSLDEEQEKELEQEIEEQRIMERPPAMKPAKPFFDEALKALLNDGSTDKMIECLKTKRSLFSIATSLQHTQLFRRYHRKNKEAWAKHLLVTKDFRTVIDSTSESCDEFLRPVWWIAHIKGKDAKSASILLLLSTHECNCLLTTFQKSTKSTLFMYRPRVNKQHSSLLHEPRLQITRMDDAEQKPQMIDVSDEVQIGMYAGLMYFGSEIEQNAYCNFMGIIPRPRTKEQEEAFKAFAFENDVSNSKGFVPIGKRRYSEAISSCVGECKFTDSPADLAIKLIEAHHQTLLKESHVASILERTTKLPIENNNNDETINI